MAAGHQNVSRDAALKREKWLDDTSTDVFGMLSKTLSSVGGMLRGNSGGLSSRTLEDAWKQRNTAQSQNSGLSEVVDQSEAAWLVERIGRDGVIHENEKALIRYLKKESPELDMVLQPLLNKVA